jgi:AAA15 family ATPase/GTPase
MTKQIDEDTAWVKENLSKLWNDSQANYYTQSATSVQKSFFENKEKSTIKSKDTTNEKSNRKKSLAFSLAATDMNSQVAPTSRGLYAYQIWENIRESSNNKLKQLDLEKELQVITAWLFSSPYKARL